MTGARELPQPPLECALCGMPRWNDESVVWIGPSEEERVPYCADDCAAHAGTEKL